MELRIIAAKDKDVRKYIDTVEPFNGDGQFDLFRFIQAIDVIDEELALLPKLQSKLRLGQIKNKLLGRAKIILNENPESWFEIKRLLKLTFRDKDCIKKWYDDLHKITFEGTISKTFRFIQFVLAKILNNIYLSVLSDKEKETIASDAKKLAYDHLLSLLPDKCKDVLKDRENLSIYDIMMILEEHNLLNERIPDNRNEDNKAPFHYEGAHRKHLRKLLNEELNITPLPIDPMNVPSASSAASAREHCKSKLFNEIKHRRTLYDYVPKKKDMDSSSHEKFKFTEPAPGEWCEFLGDFVPRK